MLIYIDRFKRNLQKNIKNECLSCLDSELAFTCKKVTKKYNVKIRDPKTRLKPSKLAHRNTL